MPEAGSLKMLKNKRKMVEIAKTGKNCSVIVVFDNNLSVPETNCVNKSAISQIALNIF